MAAVICVGYKVSAIVAYKTDGGRNHERHKDVRKWNLLNKKEEEKKK